MASTQAIRAGKTFVEVYLDKTKFLRGLNSAEKDMANFARNIKQIGKISLAAGLGLNAIGQLAAKRFATVADALAKMAKRTGFSVESLSELKYAADLSGASVESLETSIRRMQRTVYDAGMGMKSAKDALAQLGLSVEMLKGMKPEDQFETIAESLSKVQDPTTRAALAMVIFGRSGTALLPMLEQGKAGIKAMREEAQKLGLTMSGEAAARAEILADSFDRLKKVIDQVVINIGSALQPIINRMIDLMTRIGASIGIWLNANHDIIQSIYSFTPVLIAFGLALIAITNPLGVVAAGVVAFGIKFGVTMESIKGVAVTTGQAMYQLAKYFADTFKVMTEALTAGDWAAAAKALWIGLQIVWIDGVEKVKQITMELSIGFLQAISDMASNSKFFDDIITNMVNGINLVIKAALNLGSVFYKTMAKYNEMQEGLAGVFSDAVQKQLGWDKYGSEKDKYNKLAEESDSQSQKFTIDTKIDNSTRFQKLAEKAAKYEEERRKAQAAGDNARKKALEEQLALIKSQIKTSEMAAGFAAGAAGGGAAGGMMSAPTVKGSETIGMFGSSAFNRLGLGSTVTDPMVAIMEDIRDNTAAMATSLE